MNNTKQEINKVQIIQDSISPQGNRLVTFEIETYRYIWAEVLTHKMLGKNAQSSRAVPSKSVLEINEGDPVQPIIWGKNKSGMSSIEELQGEALEKAKAVWMELAKTTFKASKELTEIGLHKQWANRPTEAFSRIKAVISGTEWENFYWLRIDPEAAQPEIVDLANKMKAAAESSTPFKLHAGELHVPYVYRERGKYGLLKYYNNEQKETELQEHEALQVSASCCCQVSYRKLNKELSKVYEIYDRLFDGAKPHLSPTEHNAQVMKVEKLSSACSDIELYFPWTWETGVSHLSRDLEFWSGNLKGFIQYRKLLELDRSEKGWCYKPKYTT